MPVYEAETSVWDDIFDLFEAVTAQQIIDVVNGGGGGGGGNTFDLTDATNLTVEILVGPAQGEDIFRTTIDGDPSFQIGSSGEVFINTIGLAVGDAAYIGVDDGISFTAIGDQPAAVVHGNETIEGSGTNLLEVRDASGTLTMYIDPWGDFYGDEGYSGTLQFPHVVGTASLSGGGCSFSGGRIQAISGDASSGGLVMQNNGGPLDHPFVSFLVDGMESLRISKNGDLVLGRSTAPDTSDPDVVSNGQFCLYMDATHGAAKLKIKGKDANGTVVQGEIALS